MPAEENDDGHNDQQRDNHVHALAQWHGVQLGLAKRCWACTRLERESRQRRSDGCNNHRSHTQNGKLAQGIECTEFHDDSSDNIVAAGDIRSIVQVPHGQIGALVAAHESPHA